MVKVLAVCGNGLGTSMLIQKKVQKFLTGEGIAAQTDSCSLAESNDKIADYNIVLCSQHLVGQMKSDSKAHIVGLKNLMDQNEFGPKLKDIITSHFSDSMS